MYLLIVIGLMLVLPLLSILCEVVFFSANTDIIIVAGKWFVFWAFGVRLFLAGLRQSIQPQFTAEKIFEIKNPESHVIVQELGFANIAMGFLGILSLFKPQWMLPCAVLGTIFYGLAGAKHLFNKRNATENIALISDIFISLIFLTVSITTLVK